MIVTLLTIALAYVWLLYETDWLKVRLPMGETDAEYDSRVLNQLDAEYKASAQYKYDQAYGEWLRRRYEPILVRGFDDYMEDYPQDKWLEKEEQLSARRNGEMIYQRGVRVYGR